MMMKLKIAPMKLMIMTMIMTMIDGVEHCVGTLADQRKTMKMASRTEMMMRKMQMGS